MNKNKEYQQRSLQKYYRFGLYLVIIVLINLVGITLFLRVDLTSNDLYSLSKASKDVVSSIKEPLTINVFFSKNLPPPYNNIELYLHDLLAEYEVYSNRNLNYRFYDVTAKEGEVSEEAEENRQIARSYGIHPVSVQRIERDETKVQRAYMGIALIHGDLVEKIPAVTTTDGLEYKITNAIQKMTNKISALQNLPEKIKITLVLSSSLSRIAGLIKLEGMEGLKAKLQEVVDRLNEKTYGQLQFVHIDPSMGEGTPEQLRAFERFGLQWPQINAPDGSTIPPGKGMIAVALSYGDKSLERNLLSRKMALTPRGFQEQYLIVPVDQVETFINENIENLIDIHEDLGYLSSHGAPSLMRSYMPEQQMMMPQRPETLMRFNGLLSREYTVKEITLEDEIPESIDTLIIAGPKTNFNDWELFQIDQFLLKGKSLAVFVDSFNEIRPQQRQRGFQQPVYLPINTGLEKLLDHYGMKVKKSYLLDENCYVQRGRNVDEMPIYFAPLIQNEKINHGIKFMENLKQLLVIKASPLEANEEKIKKHGLKLKQLFASSDKSWEMTGRINLMPFMIRPPADEKQKKSLPLAYLLEGEFPSYFADKPVPEKPKKEEEEETKDEKDEGDTDKKDKDKAEPPKPEVKETAVKKAKGILSRGKPGKIFLIGTAEILKDNALDEQGISPNAVFILNTLDYLNNQEDIAVMRSKNQRFNPLDADIKSFTKTVVKVFNIAGLPALLILFGVFVWLNRMGRKRRIQDIFTRNK
ncbi:MAG: hypothetical protein GTO45_34625 [Candidatus Aminicenantes bacterium]|nr:hypothetical protein [Candidatus Aminicenantes bacterium]NIM84739.1 hypothetical protein [Candidatus Aminicenantes bacterium]NIN23294.1 hypothetical protein [Candidatus Aminicenantes bacterium]NIN46998.1 hypothetical protein [Candidatus Aminicenantes bacterium]NIN89920.1 hypothetical protein [Candidatus Aminicenantes bacterium]